MNRVRYSAMLQRADEAEASLWHRVIARMRRSNADKAQQAPPRQIPEDLLVALSAIKYCSKQAVESTDFPGRVTTDLSSDMNQHLSELEDQTLDQYWKEFEKLSSGIRVH